MAINNFNVGVGTTSQLTRYRYVATGGETSISGTDADGKTLSYTVGLEQVFLNGVNLVRGQDYTATNGTSVGSFTALVASDVVEVFAYVPFNIANALTVSTVDAKGDLLVGTGADAVGRLAVGTNGQMLVADSAATTGLKWNTGGILQVASTVKSDSFSTSSTSFVDLTGLSVSITPTYSTSKILITVTLGSVGSNAGLTMFFNLVRGSTAIAQPSSGASASSFNGAFGGSGLNSPFSLTFLDSPSTTSSTTYKIQTRVDGGTGFINSFNSPAGYTTVSTITVMEVSA